MFESLLTVPLALDRHRSAPYRAERESFLEQQRKQGASDHNLLQIASRLIDVVRYDNIERTEGAGFDGSSVQQDAGSNIETLDRTRYETKLNLQFHRISQTVPQISREAGGASKPAQPFSDKLEQFVDFLLVEKSLRPQTVHGQRWHISQFLRWYATRHKSLSASFLKEIDNYLMGQTEKWSGWTSRSGTRSTWILSLCGTKCWCRRLLAEAIKGPHIRKDAARWPKLDRRSTVTSTRKTRHGGIHESASPTLTFCFIRSED